MFGLFRAVQLSLITGLYEMIWIHVFVEIDTSIVIKGITFINVQLSTLHEGVKH